MGNSQSHSYHLNGHGSTSNGGSSSSRKSTSESVDSGRGSPTRISKEEMESRFSQLVVRDFPAVLLPILRRLYMCTDIYCVCCK